MRINTKYNLLFVKGPNIPGPVHGYVRIMDCIFRHRRVLKTNTPMPTWFPEDAEETLPEDIYSDKMYQFGQPTVVFKEEKQMKQKKKTKGKK